MTPCRSMDYVGRRIQAITMAQLTNHWEMPMTPDAGPSIGRLVPLGRGRWTLVPHSAALDAAAKAKEKRQNRERF